MPKRPALDLNGPGASPAEQQEAPKKKKQQLRKPALALTPPEGTTREDEDWVPKHLTAAQFEALNDDEKALVRKIETTSNFSTTVKAAEWKANRNRYCAIIDSVAAQTDPKLALEASPERPANRDEEFWIALTEVEQHAIDWLENLGLDGEAMWRRADRMALELEGKSFKKSTFQNWVKALKEKHPAPSPTAYEMTFLSDQPKGKALKRHYETTLMTRQLPSERYANIEALAVRINKKFTTKGEKKSPEETHDEFVARITARAQAQQQHLIDAAQQRFDPILPDFTAVNYTELPHTVLLDIAAGRDLLPKGRGVQDYSRLLDLLWQDDAEKGILPIGDHILQVTSRPIIAAGRLSAIAEKNQQALRDLAQRQDVSEPDFERQSDWTKLFNADLAKEGNKNRHSALVSDCAKRLHGLTRKGFSAHCLTLSLSHLRFIMEFLDALEGIPPQALSYGDTKYHRMGIQQLKEYGQRMGMPVKKVGGRLLKKADFITWLMEKSPSSALSEPLSNDQVSILITQVRPHVADIPEGLGLIDVGDLTAVNCTDVMITHTQGLLAERGVFEKLEAAIFDGLLPDSTSSDRRTQLLDALACALRARQSKDFSADHDSGITNTLNADMIGRLMFSDYQDLIENGSPDEEESSDDLNLEGTPTPEYEEFLRKILHPVSGTAEYHRLRAIFTRATDIQPLHAAVIPSFLYDNGLTLSNYPIGILIAGGVSADGSPKPATARIIRSDDSMGDPLWLLSYQYGMGYNDHFWAPFVSSGSLWDLLRQFGLHVLFDIDLPAPKTLPLADQSERAVKTRNQARTVKKQRMISHGCSACSDGGRADCNGDPDTGCSTCHELGISCEFAPHQIAKHQYDLSRSLMGLELSEVTDDAITTWETLDADLEAVNDLARNAQPTPIDGDATYFVAIFCMRCSSTPTAAYFQLLLQRALGYRTRYNIMLNDPAIVTTEGQRPGGAGTQMQSYFKVFTAPGFRPVPSQLTNNMTQPLEIGFINHLHHVVSPQNPNKPIRYQFVTAGLAGNAVGIDAYGSRTHGFFKFVLDNDPQLADRIDVVNVIEPHVYSGFPHSIPLARRQYFTFYSGKYVIKNKLADLLDYFYQIQNAAINNVQPPPFNNDPIYSQRLLSHILLAEESWAWRARHLHAGTQPTDQEVDTRNVNRNGPWP